MRLHFPALLFFSLSATFAQVTPTEANLRAGIDAGGAIVFNADGLIALTSPIVVTKDVAIDATGHTVTVDGQNTTRIFEVNSGVRLTITNLTLANGRKQGAESLDSNQPGESVFGGALVNNGGIVTIVNCTFASKLAVGGSGYVANPLQPNRLWTPGGS